MRRIYIIYWVIIGCVWFSACTEHEDVYRNRVPEEIRLNAVVDEVKNISRNSSSAANDTMQAAVWFSLQQGKYPKSLPDSLKENPQMVAMSAESNVPIHTVIKFKSGVAASPDTVETARPRYPTEGSVYCVGFIPSVGWNTEAGDSTVTRKVLGTEDLMFAPQIEGSWNSHFPTQRFRHLLTWLKINVCATTAEAGNYWGKLKKITLFKVPTQLTINLNRNEGDNFNLRNAVAFSDTTDVDILDTQTGVDLGVTIKEVTSTFCHPQQTYKLIIECENGMTKDVPITLSSLTGEEISNFPSGLQYVLTLYFHPFNVVEGVCTLKEWNAQNEDLYPN